MKILITGGCGFVGSNIAIYLKKKFKKFKISSLDNLVRRGSQINKGRLKKHKIKNYNFDIVNFNKIKTLPKFDLIIDCCAEPAIEESRKNPDKVFNTNLVGTFNILKKCIKDKANLIFLSSSRVYSIKELREYIKQNNFLTPIKSKKQVDEKFETSSASSLYGFTKIASEKLIKEFFYTTNLKYIINRFGVIAGPWQFGKQDQGFVTLWVAKHFFKKKLSYIGFNARGHQVRDVLHIEDACKIITIQIKNLKKIKNMTFNIGGGIRNLVSPRDLTIKCQKLTKNRISIGKIFKTSSYDIPYYVTNNSKINKIYNWKPVKNVDDILRDIYFWLKENKKVRNFFK